MNSPHPVLPPTADFQSTWAFLEEGVDHIVNKLHTGVSYSKYMSLYTVAYNYCTSAKIRSSDLLGSGNRTGANLMGLDLYNNLVRYFTINLQSLRQIADGLQDEALLRYYANEWDRYTTGANYTNRLFTYLNRHWVKRERDEGRRQVYPIYTLALKQWTVNLFTPLHPRLTCAVLRMIKSQRDGASIDQGLIKSVINSFVSLGLDETDVNKECLQMYKEHFERPFFETTAAYYRQESKAFLESHSVSDYLKKAEERLREEEYRVERYLNSASRKVLMSMCERILIQEHQETMYRNFQQLLEFERDEDLRRMHALFSRLPGGLEPLYKEFENFVKNAGLSAILTLVGEADEDGDFEDPKAYVNTLLAVYNKHKGTVQRSFRGQSGFMASLDRANQDYVNRNAVTGSSDLKSPELLAKYADLVLRKNNKMAGGDDVEAALHNVIILLQYTNDKDIFLTFYHNRLLKRLVHGVSASEDSETFMVSKIGETCGFGHTGRLKKILEDTKVSKDLTDGFKLEMQRSGATKVDFSITTLANNVWSSQTPKHEFVIPREILSTHTKFRQYYRGKYSGRDLTYLWNYCKNELTTNYLNQNYLLLTSTYQMAVLLQFNNHDTLSLEELFRATSIPKDYLEQVLALLVKAKILINEETDQYDLNPDFRSKKIRINLNLPIRTEQKAEVRDVQNHVAEDRKLLIQATIVRIMKARRQMKHHPLIQEVITLVSRQFKPQIPDVKKAIDSLLEREYIERVDGTRDTYQYTA